MIEKTIKLKNSVALNVMIQEGQSEPVLLLHFSGGTSSMWSGIVPLFNDEYTLIAPDLRGHGKSEKPVTGYHIDDMAEDMFLLLKELKINSCHVIGSSLGAEVGLSLATAHPEVVASLVCEGAMYNEFGEYGIFEGGPEEILKEQERLSGVLRERVLPVHPSKEAFVAEMKESFLKQGLWNEHFRIFAESCAEETEEGTFTSHYKNHVRIEYIEKYWSLKFEDYYKKVQCPVLFLPSEEEWKNPRIRKSFEAFSSLLKKYEVIHIPSSVHAYVWMQNANATAEAVKDFIRQKQNTLREKKDYGKKV